MVFNKRLEVPKPVHHEYHEPIIYPQPKMDDLDMRGLNLQSQQSYPQEMPTRDDFMPPEQHHRKVVRDNTLFVKIDMYRESMRTLNLIKEGMMNTEHILNKLGKIKEEEEREISEWHEEIKRMKQKIMFIDKNLFENEQP